MRPRPSGSYSTRWGVLVFCRPGFLQPYREEFGNPRGDFQRLLVSHAFQLGCLGLFVLLLRLSCLKSYSEIKTCQHHTKINREIMAARGLIAPSFLQLSPAFGPILQPMGCTPLHKLAQLVRSPNRGKGRFYGVFAVFFVFCGCGGTGRRAGFRTIPQNSTTRTPRDNENHANTRAGCPVLIGCRG